MAERIIESNKVIISGEIVSDFKFNHELFGEKFYRVFVSSLRLSGTPDIIPVLVSDRVISVKDGDNWEGKFVSVKGRLSSYDKRIGKKRKLILDVFAREFSVLDERDDTNMIIMEGYVCKQPVYRETPLGREIGEVLLAVNRPYGKSDYIPCIAWGRNARFVDFLDVGEYIMIKGRIQSREYEKKISDTETETRVTYEVSASSINIIEEVED